MYEVEISQLAQKFLEKLDSHTQQRIEKRLLNLKSNPVPSDAKFIGRSKESDKIFRYRIGNYRALYLVLENSQIVLIAKIDKRPRIYK